MSAPRILATGRCLPARVVTNEELSERVDTNDEWVFSRTGIHQRHFCTSESGLDLAASAARQAMDRALDLLERRAGASLVVQRGNACEVVPLAEVAYCEVQGRKLYLHRAGGSVLDYYGRLEDLERRVDRRFFKCHRSYLVNLDYVQSLRDGQVLLPRKEAIPVSRLRERELAQALLRRMKERGA